MSYLSLTNGAFDIKLMDVVRTLLRLDSQPDQDLVILEFRLPRIVIAALVGMGLGIAGAVIQGITRNGLADPGILGINAGAGAAIVIFLFFFQGKIKGIGLGSIMAMPLFGLIGGLLAAFLIYLFAWKKGKLEPQRLLLTGIAIASGLGAVSLFLSLKMNANDFEMAVVWNSGSIYNANWKYILAALPWLLVLIPIIIRKSYILDLFQLHEDSVISLGIASEKEKAVLLLCSIGIVSSCVSVSGGIGFIGLMAPHIAKRLVGSMHRRILPVCGIVGALLVMISDLIGRTIFAPTELPAGIVVAIIGVPYFIFLLYRKKGRN
ncbi:iron ABC transporter permease [Paenibacillus sp. J2TS4]|uniref:FecCD family ABC transporter permease n=1 Tax=Paenibacillus sp. J2TS4 TaxID=2807194 RepID=UPI001BCBAC01